MCQMCTFLALKRAPHTCRHGRTRFIFPPAYAALKPRPRKPSGRVCHAKLCPASPTQIHAHGIFTVATTAPSAQAHDVPRRKELRPSHPPARAPIVTRRACADSSITETAQNARRACCQQRTTGRDLASTPSPQHLLPSSRTLPSVNCER
eukprot:1845373-Pleurochrysis_carterae.AAC.1